VVGVGIRVSRASVCATIGRKVVRHDSNALDCHFFCRLYAGDNNGLPNVEPVLDMCCI
jgi:hypothetical protein